MRAPSSILPIRLLARIACTLLAAALSACASVGTPPDLAQRRDAVVATERAFAQTMADRDLAGFTRFLSDEAVFISGKGPLRGATQITDAWKRFYEGPAAPFSWEPETVEVLDSGTLALSTGPVRDPSGQKIGCYNSIWRLEEPGVWRIIFDKGCE